MPHDTTHIPEGWRETTLGENIVQIAMGPFGSNLKVDMFTEKGVPIIKGSNLFGLYVNGDYTFVSEEKATSLGRSVAYPGDFVITHRGTLGQVALVPDNNYPRYVASQSQLRFNVDKNTIDNLYLLYFLKSSSGQYELLKNASQVGVPAIATPTKAIKDINLLLPPLSEQRAIAAMLSSLDAKIELLRDQNETLEKTAQTIFHEWFGQYSVESPEELPEGWRVDKLEDLTSQMNSGGTPSTKEGSYYNGVINWFSTKELQDNFIFESEKKITDFGLKNSSAKLFPENTVVMAIYAAPTVGRLGILTKESTFNQAAVGLVAKDEIGYPFIYLLLKYLRDELNGLANGAAQQNLNVGLVKNFKIIIPDKEMLKQFHETIHPIFTKIRNNSEQIQSLSKTRDTLLPKLMSGEMRAV